MPIADFLTLAAPSQGVYKDRGSRFLAYAEPVGSAVQAQDLLSGIRAEHHSARHVCYAYVLGARGEEFRLNDDGEPSGTGGRPIYGAIQSRELRNVMVAVVRYFGGIKLGVPGLIAAYRGATDEALDTAQIIRRAVEVRYHLRFDYAQQHEVMEQIKRTDGRIQSERYLAQCEIEVEWDLIRAEEALHRLKTIAEVVPMQMGTRIGTKPESKSHKNYS